MLIGIGEIKDKLGVLTTISSNVSSILSKVNNLGSQKKYTLSYSNTLYNNATMDLSGAGLVIVSNINQSYGSFAIGGVYFQIPKESVLTIPIGSSKQIRNETGFTLYVAWCSLS